MLSAWLQESFVYSQQLCQKREYIDLLGVANYTLLHTFMSVQDGFYTVPFCQKHTLNRFDPGDIEFLVANCLDCRAIAAKIHKERREEREALEAKATEKKLAETREEFSNYQKHGRYMYVHGDNIQELIINVNKKIEEGYEPLGSPDITTYLQFMLKTKKD